MLKISKKILILVLSVGTLALLAKLLIFNSVKCQAIWSITQDSEVSGRLHLPIEETCKRIKLDVGGYVEDLNVLSAWKMNEKNDTISKRVDLFTVRDDKLQKLSEPSCYKQIQNEKESEIISDVKVKCEDDVDYSILMNAIQSAKTKLSEDKRHLFVTYEYSDAIF